MKTTIKTTLALAAAAMALSAVGCGSNDATARAQSVTVTGEHGKVYSGSANQVTTQMGQDYAAGLRARAGQTAPQQ